MSKEKRNLIIAGVLIGAVSVALVALGNPKNMGFCIACFIRDIAGATKLHSAAVVQYVRPEIIGLVLGAWIISMATGEFKSRGGSSPMLRFIIGAFVMIGALVFLGCPFRMILRLAGGDLNALVALFGFIAGIACGCFFLSRGFSLGRYYKQNSLEGHALPAVNILLLVLLIAVPSVFAFSEKGPGSMHAAILISLAAGLIVGILAQKTRLCMVGGIRDIILVKDYTLIFGFIFIFVAALIGNLITGNFKLGFEGQPVAQTAHLWNFLGMFIVGLGSSMLGGCPLRQLILAGEGNSDSAVAVLGMFTGAAVAHNFKLVGNATENGPNTYGKVAVIAIIIILLAIAAVRTFKEEK
ncbi:MAG: YedE-related selenium metabolism membrane protein [Sphaerochaetaceae bacterium]|nr:YedE-related selenium metabolism membrane protein [Sphaerochaetaceae bacterium]